MNIPCELYPYHEIASTQSQPLTNMQIISRRLFLRPLLCHRLRAMGVCGISKRCVNHLLLVCSSSCRILPLYYFTSHKKPSNSRWHSISLRHVASESQIPVIVFGPVSHICTCCTACFWLSLLYSKSYGIARYLLHRS